MVARSSPAPRGDAIHPVAIEVRRPWTETGRRPGDPLVSAVRPDGRGTELAWDRVTAMSSADGPPDVQVYVPGCVRVWQEGRGPSVAGAADLGGVLPKFINFSHKNIRSQKSSQMWCLGTIRRRKARGKTRQVRVIPEDPTDKNNSEGRCSESSSYRIRSGPVLRQACTVELALGLGKQEDVRFPVAVWKCGDYPMGSTAGVGRVRAEASGLMGDGCVPQGSDTPCRRIPYCQVSSSGSRLHHSRGVAFDPGRGAGQPGSGPQGTVSGPNKSGCDIASQPAKHCFVDHWPIG